MPFVFACAGCGRPLSAREEFAGRQIKCPACQTPQPVPMPPALPLLPPSPFTAEPPPPVPPPSAMPEGDPFAFGPPPLSSQHTPELTGGFDPGEDREATRPRRVDRGPLDPGWQSVARGLLLVQLSLFGIPLGLGITVLAVMASHAWTGPRGPGPGIIRHPGELILIASIIVGLIGHIFIALVPGDAEDARVYAIIAAVCAGLCCLVVPGVVGMLLLSISVRQMCRRLRFADLEQQANTYTLVLPILTLLLGALPLPVYCIMFASYLGAFRAKLLGQIRIRGVRRPRYDDDDDFDDEPRPRRRRRREDVFDD